MKYIMLETDDGFKLPFVFPETITHAFITAFIIAGVQRERGCRSRVVSAGFVSFSSFGVRVHGDSESLDLESNPADAMRIEFGDSVHCVPDSMVERLAEQCKPR